MLEIRMALTTKLTELLQKLGLRPDELPHRIEVRARAIEIFVGNHRVGPSQRITVSRFAATANGDVPPTSDLYVNNATAVARDRQGNIYVASDTGNQVQVYAPSAVGLAARLRNLQGPATRIWRPSGLAVDYYGYLYVAERGGASQASALLKFAPGADGNVAPIAVIPSQKAVVGEPTAVNTRMEIASGVALDDNGAIYVVTCSDGLQRQGASKLLIFPAAASGDVPPAVEITSGLAEPQQVTLGRDGRIYVTNRGDNRNVEPSVAVYAPFPVANAAPVRVITSAELDAPFGIAVDGHDMIFVADPGKQSVLVFDAAATGNVTPLRKIEGSSTGLSDPMGVALRESARVVSLYRP